MTGSSGESGGPRLRAQDPWLPGNPSRESHQLLSDDERARLATVASIVRFKKGAQIYSDGEPAKALFNIIGGVIKIYRPTTEGGEYVCAFLYPEDLFGLTEEGRYVNSAKAVTSAVMYSLPLSSLQRPLFKDADLEFHVIVKLCHELRHAQRHALLLGQKQALSKLAMFLQLQEHCQSANGIRSPEIHLPMNRSEIADYVSMSLAAVSRGFRSLETRGVIEFRDRRHVKIVDRKALEALAGNSGR
jgi:CRP/FNR family transcriptional regulator